MQTEFKNGMKQLVADMIEEIKAINEKIDDTRIGSADFEYLRGQVNGIIKYKEEIISLLSEGEV